MSRRWVANASPLILLGKVGQVDLLRELTDELILPEIVVREVTDKPDGEQVIEELTSVSGVELVADRPVPHLVEVWDLGPGESQVVLLAQDEPGSRAVLDDLEARRCAASMGVPVIGTLGVVLRAAAKGVIPAARPVLEQLRDKGLYVTSELLEKALRHLNE